LKIAFDNKYILILATLFSLALFGPSIYFNYFIFDDAVLIYENLKIVNTSWSEAFKYWSLSNTPIIYNVWQLISSLFGTSEAAPFRFLNILLHGVNCFLVYIWCKEMLLAYVKESESKLLDERFIEQAALIGFIVFALHPVHVEAVVWVSSLKEVLAATFGLGSFICFLKNNKRQSIYLEVSTVLLYLLGMLTHPTVAALPLVYIWLDAGLWKKSFKEVFFKNGVFFLLLISAVIIHKTVNPQVLEIDEQPIYVRISVAINAMFGYLERAFVPTKYSFDYMMTPYDVIRSTQDLAWPKLKAFLGGAFIWLLIYSYRKQKLHFLHFPLTLTILLVSVNLGLIGYAFQNISTISDRFLYLPSIGTSLFFGFLYLILKKNQIAHKTLKMVTASFCLYLFIFWGMSVHRINLWSSSSRLLSTSIGNGYNSYPLALSLGTALWKQGNSEAALLQLEKAFELAEKRDEKGKKLTPVQGDEPLALMFRIHLQDKDKVKGLLLYKKLLNSQVHITPELAWSMAEYLISVDRWYEADKLVKEVEKAYAYNETVKNLKLRVEEIKQHTLVGSYLNLGIESLDRKDYSSAKKFFQQALVANTLKTIDESSLKDLLTLTEKLKSETLITKKTK
jgi:tetratricopeptide (TPR) repeat protein